MIKLLFLLLYAQLKVKSEPTSGFGDKGSNDKTKISLSKVTNALYLVTKILKIALVSFYCTLLYNVPVFCKRFSIMVLSIHVHVYLSIFLGRQQRSLTGKSLLLYEEP